MKNKSNKTKEPQKEANVTVKSSVEDAVETNVNLEDTKEESKAEETATTSETEGDKVYITAGDRNCYVYFNLQYTGLRMNTSLISLALVDADGRSFYAEFTDYDMSQVDAWVLENVLKKLTKPETVLDGDHWAMTGTRKEIRTQLYFWLDRFVKEDRIVQFVGDVAHLSFSLLLDLLIEDKAKTFIDLPTWISPALVDLNQDLASVLYRNKPDEVSQEEFDKNYVPVSYAFTINRMESAADLLQEEGSYNNALYQAKIIRALHQHIWSI